MKDFNVLTQECLDWVEERFKKKYNNYEETLEKYKELKDFKISENVFNINENFTNEIHFIMRLITQYHMECVFRAMKIDMCDSNVTGETGTPYRVVKTWTGADLNDDTELMSGRWVTKPKLTCFPNESGRHDPVFVEVEINAVCSHHLIRWGVDYSDENSKVVIGYIPREFVGGLSKISRAVNYLASRGHLQEEATRLIGKMIEEEFKTDSVFVGLFNMKHGCQSYRGIKDVRGATTTQYKSGDFLTDPSKIPSKYNL